MQQWYLGENGQQSGPVSDAELSSLIATGRIGPTTLLWREGLPSWKSLTQLSADGNLPMVPAYAGYNLMQPATTSGMAIASLICGIVGLVTCIVILGIPAIICGHMALNQIGKSEQVVVGRGMAIGGLATGYLCLLFTLSIVGLIIFGMAKMP